jgi:uncharacterized delta-60 repeat protein
LNLEALEDRTVPAGMNLEWVQQFGGGVPAAIDDFAQAVASDAAGNVYVTGYYHIPGGVGLPYEGTDIFVRKFDASGVELWARQFGFPGSFYPESHVAVDASGVYVTGTTHNTLPGQTSAGSNDAFVRKYDVNGAELWTRQFGSAVEETAHGIAVDASGVYVTGDTNGAMVGQISAGNNDVFVRKYDLSGAELWTRQFGSSGLDTSSAVAADGVGVYIAGYTAGQASVSDVDAFVRAYDASGAELWARQFDATNQPGSTSARAIAADTSGVYVTGASALSVPGETNSYYNDDAFVRKYDSGGTELWTRHFDFAGMQEIPQGISVDASGVYVSGDSGGTPMFSGPFVRAYDANGAERWTQRFGATSADQGKGITVTNGGAIVVGMTTGVFPDQTTSGGYDAFVRRYDVGGTELWTRQFGHLGPAEGAAEAIAGDEFGNVYVVGYSAGALVSQSSAGSNDAYVSKYDASGAVLWTRQFGTSSGDFAQGIAVDASGIYVTGYTGGDLSGQASMGGDDAFVRKYDDNGSVLWTDQFGTAYSDMASAIVADASGIYVVGVIHSECGDGFARKYDANGTVLWTRELSTSTDDRARGVAVDATGVYVAGITTGSLSDQAYIGNYDAFVTKYDAAGAELWTRQFGSAESDVVNAVAVDDSGVYLTGATQSNLPGQVSAGSFDAFIRKYDTNGVEVWTRQFGTDLSDIAEGITVDASGIYVTGQANNAVLFVRNFDSAGNLLDTFVVGEFNQGNASAIDVNASGAFIAGFTVGSFSETPRTNLPEAFIAKLNFAPVVEAMASPSASVPVNSPITTFSANFTNPDTSDTHTAEWIWGDGSSSPGTVVESNGAGTVTGSHTYSSTGFYVATLIVTDASGATAEVASQSFAVYDPNGTPPTPSISGESGGTAPAVGFIGESVTYTGAVVDIGNTFNFPYTFEWSVAASNGDIIPSLSGSLADYPGPYVLPAFSFVPTLLGTYTVTLTVTDHGGVSGADSVTFISEFSAPLLSGITVPTTSVPVNSLITTFSSTFVNNASETHTAEWFWSDGTSSPGIVIEDNGAGTVTGSHTFLTADIVSATLIVTDSGGAAGVVNSAAFFVYDPNGTPPTPFISGRTGKVLQANSSAFFGGYVTDARAIAEDPTTGNLIVLTDNGGLRINRFLPNGMPDLSFFGGWLDFDNAITASRFGLAVDSAGGILIAGSVDGGVTGMDFAVTRYNPDGILDTSFGDGGVATADVGSAEDWGQGLTLDDQGRILVIGHKTNSVDGAHDAALVRWTAAGDPDPFFGNDGTVVYDTGGDEIAASLAADPTTGDIVATIRVDGSLHLIRFDSAGNGEDVPFDNVVDVGFAPLGFLGAAAGVAVDESGRILLAGYQGRDFAVVRYDEEGALDPSFGDNGVATIHVGPPGILTFDVAQGISLDSQGRILLAGYAWLNDWDSAWPALARLKSTGAPDRSFGDAGGPSTLYGFDPGGPAPAVGFIGEPVSYMGAVVDIGDTFNFPFTYEWSVAASNGDIIPSLSGSLGDYPGPYVIPEFSFVPTSGGTYTVTLTVTGYGGVSGAVSVITTVSGGSTDADSDGIDNAIDTLPAFSDDFSDGITSGTIVLRGEQVLTIIDAPNSGDGVIISAAASGGSDPAIISIDVDGGVSLLYIGPGDEVMVTHGSVIIHVVAGTIETTFVAETGETAFVSLDADNGLVFEPDTFTFTAPDTNTVVVQVTITTEAGEEVSAALPSGNSVAFEPDTGTFVAPETNTQPIEIIDSSGAVVTVDPGEAVDAINHAPSASNDSFQTAEDQSVSGNVLANDNDVDASDVLTVTAVNGQAAGVGQPLALAHGTLILSANGAFTYTPGADCEAASDSFTYTISDGHGGAATATVTITITQYTGVTSSGGVLRVGGTAAADVMTVSGGNLIVNGVPYSLAGITEVRVWGRGGNDQIDLSGLGVKCFIHGGQGNDGLTGGSGDDVVIGGGGADTITGGAGNDFLIGGDGADRIVGSAGHDILVAGDIGCALDLAALRAVSQAWEASRTVIAEAVDDFLDETVFTDDAVDQLTGSAGADLFIINTGDKITDFQFGKPNTNKDGDVVIRDGEVVS